MNVLDADFGSCSNPNTACCAATKALVVLIFKSRVNSSNGIESGLFASFGFPLEALTALVNFAVKSRIADSTHHCKRRRLGHQAML
jgi:hypothetical protein